MVRDGYKRAKKGEYDIVKFLDRYPPYLKRTRIQESEFTVFRAFLDEETVNRSGKTLERIMSCDYKEMYVEYEKFITHHNKKERLIIEDKKIEKEKNKKKYDVMDIDESFVDVRVRSYPVFRRFL